ncbi:hypothetical protein M2359_003269 [Gordonia amarae]|nr:hypothetical protein [Gordonia amarae]
MELIEEHSGGRADDRPDGIAVGDAFVGDAGLNVVKEAVKVHPDVVLARYRVEIPCGQVGFTPTGGAVEIDTCPG